jgi:hypothetical protein
MMRADQTSPQIRWAIFRDILAFDASMANGLLGETPFRSHRWAATAAGIAAITDVTERALTGDIG